MSDIHEHAIVITAGKLGESEVYLRTIIEYYEETRDELLAAAAEQEQEQEKEKEEKPKQERVRK
jgi:hypothetical protein